MADKRIKTEDIWDAQEKCILPASKDAEHPKFAIGDYVRFFNGTKKNLKRGKVSYIFRDPTYKYIYNVCALANRRGIQTFAVKEKDIVCVMSSMEVTKFLFDAMASEKKRSLKNEL